MEENTQLPVEIRKTIWTEAEKYTEGKVKAINKEHFNVYNAYIDGATAYATKLIEVRQENDSLTNQLKKHGEVSNENIKLLRRENEKLRVDRNEAKKLLDEVFRKHEAGLLPDRFIYEKIKTFLYGE